MDRDGAFDLRSSMWISLCIDSWIDSLLETCDLDRLVLRVA